MEFFDHHMVVGNFLIVEKTNTKDEPVNYHMSDLPLCKLEDVDVEGWLEVNRLLSEHS